MDLKNLRTFIYVAELGSFTQAAARLGFSQSTISFQVRQLEEELNVRLFERIHHTVKLTEQGREVLRYAHQVDNLTQELSSGLREESAELTGYVRLAMADSLCSRMSGSFRTFQARHPGISLKVIAADTETMIRLLDHNEVDLVLTLDNHIFDKAYTLIREERIGTHFVTATDSPLAQRENVPVQEVIQYPFLLTEKGMSYRRLMDERLAERSLAVQPALEVGNTELICRLVEQGAGCAFLPDYATEHAVQAGRLARLTVRDFEIEIWKQLFCHRDKWISPQMRAVMAYCAEI